MLLKLGVRQKKELGRNSIGETMNNPTEKSVPKVFISYAKEDLAQARRLYNDLKTLAVRRSFEEADLIIGLTVPVWIRDIRVVRRFLKRRLGLLQSKKKETWVGFFKLLKWNHGYDQDHFIRIKDTLSEFEYKVVYCKTIDEVLQIVET